MWHSSPLDRSHFQLQQITGSDEVSKLNTFVHYRNLFLVQELLNILAGFLPARSGQRLGLSIASQLMKATSSCFSSLPIKASIIQHRAI